MTEKEQVLVQVENRFRDKPVDSVADLKKSLLTLKSGVLYRKPSTLLPRAGFGLFCKRLLRRGELFTWYGGPYVTAAEFAIIKRDDEDYLAYARSLDLAGRQRVLGNYRRNEAGQLVKVPPHELGRVFLNDGAAQFMNGMRSYADPAVNVGNAIIRSKLRMGSLLDDEDRLVREFPFEIVSIAVALTDIPPDTELITPYGDAYFDRRLTESSEASDPYDEEDDDDDGSISLNSDDDDEDDEDDDRSISLNSDSDMSSSDVEEPVLKKRRFKCVVCQGVARWQCSACKTTHYCSPTCQARCDAEGHCDCRRDDS
jgi:hypothetical protein